jgi:hypothetical protein
MNKIKISIMVVALVVIGGCKKSFLDINNSPNTATEASITPDLATAAQLNNIARRNASSWDMLNRWLGHWSASGSYSRSTVEMSYNITNTTMEGTWNDIYYVLNQLKLVNTKANSLGWKFYEGITKIMSAHEWGVLVDLYGDVPFTNALDLSGNIRPTYTAGADVYKALIPMIDEGLALIKAAGDDPNIATQDIMFGGNKTNWAKFANTLKLRLLLHAYKTQTFNTTAEIAKIVSEGSGFLGNGVGAMVNPGYSVDKPNPYYAAHLHTTSGAEADNYSRANCFTFDLMTSMQDPRRRRVYRSAKGAATTFKCTSYGANPLDENSSDKTSGPGYGLIQVGEELFTSPPTTLALTGAAKPMWVLSSVEAAFLVAEATVRGWLAGDAQAAYVNAVRESFKYLQLTSADADTYIAVNSALSSNPRVTWPAAGTMNDKLTVVMWQKYFALTGMQGNEIWSDWRRTGIVQPPLSIAPERGSNPIPRRLLYPSGEASYNADNVPKGVTQFGKVFWDL